MNNFLRSLISKINLEQLKIIRESFFGIFIRLFSALIAFFFNLIITRSMEAEEAGYFFLSLSIAIFLSALARCGFENTVLKFTAASINNRGLTLYILKYTLSWSLVISILIASAIFFYSDLISQSFFNKSGLIEPLKYISPSILGFSMVFIMAMSLQARQKFLISVPCQNIAHFVLCGAFLIFFNVDSSNEAAIYMSLSLGISALFFYWISIKDLKTDIDKNLDKKSFWSSANQNLITNITNHLLQWGGPIIIGIFLASNQVAFFAVAQRTALLTSLIIMGINLIIAPKVAMMYKQKRIEDIRILVIFAVRLSILAGIPIVILMIIFSEFLMGLFGSDYTLSANILRILILGQAVNLFTGSVGYILLMTDNEKDMKAITLANSLILLIFMPIFTSYFGIVGAALVSAFCTSFQSILAILFIRKRLGFNTLYFWQKINI